MRLQTKVTAAVLPLVIGSIFALGFWVTHRAEQGIHESTFRYIETILDLYIDDQVAPLHQVLVQNGLDAVPSYVAEYQKQAAAAADKFQLKQSAHIFAMDRRGRLVFRGLDMPAELMEKQWRGIALSVAGGEASAVRGHHAGISGHYVYAARRFDPWGWVVFFSMSDDVVHAAQGQIRLATLGMAGFCAVAAIGLILLVLHHFFVRPVTALTRAAEAIARDGAAANIPVRSSDELGRLARSMETMSRSIQTHKERRRSWQRELEDRVRVQTEHLEQALDDLRASEDRYRTLFNTMHDGFALHEIIRGDDGTPADYRFMEVNPAFGEMTGLAHADVVGKRAGEILPGLEPEWIEIFGEVALRGASVRFERYSAPLERHFDVTAYSPGFGLFATIFVDVTEQKRLEEQLRQAQKMEAIGTLAGGIAHDFNNILFPIIGYTEMTHDLVPEESKAKKNLGEVLRGCHRAKELVAQILAFSRQGEEERQPLQTQLVIKEALKLLRSSLPATITIRRKIDDRCGPILGDPTRVHQIVMNLCTNAYHAMRESGGVLEVSLSEMEIPPEGRTDAPSLAPGPYVLLTVSDTGIGMEPAVLAQVFDPYFTTKGPGEGTGLGLAVVHGIVNTYGGDIQVVSRPGAGTTFHVFLPRIERTATEPAVERERPPGGAERILLVDDEAQILKMLDYMLTSLGYETRSMESSREALKAFLAAPDQVDLVITDMTMPEMTGLRLAQEMLAARPDLPVILCTGFSALVSEREIREMGIRELVLKPVVRRDLALAVRRALNGRPAGQVSAEGQEHASPSEAQPQEMPRAFSKDSFPSP